jgi:hypothetical protein
MSSIQSPHSLGIQTSEPLKILVMLSEALIHGGDFKLKCFGGIGEVVSIERVDLVEGLH